MIYFCYNWWYFIGSTVSMNMQFKFRSQNRSRVNTKPVWKAHRRFTDRIGYLVRYTPDNIITRPPGVQPSCLVSVSRNIPVNSVVLKQKKQSTFGVTERHIGQKHMTSRNQGSTNLRDERIAIFPDSIGYLVGRAPEFMITRPPGREAVVLCDCVKEELDSRQSL